MTSVPSLLAGRYPSSTFRWTKVILPGEEQPGNAVVLGEGVPTLPLLLRAHGYSTGAFVANPIVAHNVVGLPDHFDTFDTSLKQCWSKECAERLNEKALNWIREDRNEPWFCFIHYMDVHDPFDPPLNYATRFTKTPGAYPVASRGWIKNRQARGGLTRRELQHVVEMYDGEIAYLDSRISNLFAQLRQAGEAFDLMVLVASDHGDEFMDHGGMGHGHSLYEELVRCPAILSWPGTIPSGIASDEWIENIDLVPTVLELLSIDLPREIQGKSLRPIFSGKMSSQPVFSEMRGVAVHSERWKLWQRPTGVLSLFDMGRDPLEKKNVAQEEPEILAALQEELERWQQNLTKPPPPAVSVETVTLDSQTVGMLRSLGYLE
jgi:arylsulfatase A-like enzyme